MAIMAPVQELSIGLLERLTAALPLPEPAAPPGKTMAAPGSAAIAPPGPQAGLPEIVVFSSPPMRVLSDLASAGLRQLAALLPVLEQAVHAESPAPVAVLAKAVATATRQIGDGHAALLAEGPDRVAAALRGDVPLRMGAPAVAATDTKELLRSLARQIGAETEPAQDGQTSETLRSIARQIGAADRIEPRSTAEPGAGPIERWIGEAKHVLRDTGEALDRAEQQLQTLSAHEVAGAAPPSAWALAEIIAAQAQIAGTYARLGQVRSPARSAYRSAPSTFSLDNLAGATTLLGMLLILATLWIVGGLWAVMTGIAALAGTAFWIWRISQASRGVTLDARG